VGVVLLGVMIAITLEMSGIPSLAFAVGVYLPLASSTPIFFGGMIRYLVDRWLRKHKFRAHSLTHDELVRRRQKSRRVARLRLHRGRRARRHRYRHHGGLRVWPGHERLAAWATAHNPFFNGPHADLLALIPFTRFAFCLPGWQDVFLARDRQKRERISNEVMIGERIPSCSQSKALSANLSLKPSSLGRPGLSVATACSMGQRANCRLASASRGARRAGMASIITPIRSAGGN